jgi:hypothetical protein
MIEQFCQSILQIETGNNKALANVVMGLASQTNARSVVEVSLSPCYHYQYSSINKTIDKLYESERLEVDAAKSEEKRLEVEKKFAD